VSSLQGTWKLLRFLLRRDRVRLPVWVFAIGGSILGSVASFATTYPTAADRQARAAVLSSGIARLFVGPGYGSTHYTYGAMTANELLPSAAIAVALMSVFLVVRHTRAEEESGRAELIRATAVGRHAQSAAALIEVGAAHVVLFAILAAGLPASLEGLSVTGSVAFAAALLAVGLVFAAGAAVVAQLTTTARSAVGLSAIVLGVLYLLRAIGDMTGTALAWFSPFGWATELRSYVAERWWPLGLAAAATAAAVAAAVRIAARRDLGAGIVGDRPGHGSASRRLGIPVGLALRLQRASVLAWAASTFLLGLLYGSIARDAGTFYDEVSSLRDYVARVGKADPVDQFLALSTFISAMIAVGFAIQSTLRLRTEEASHRAEPVLTASVSRPRWMASHLVVALAGSAALLLAVGVGFGVGAAIGLSDAGAIPRMIGAAFVYLPALWVFVGVAALLFGIAPRLAVATWGLFAGLIFVGSLGPLLKLPQWTFQLSPLEHVPRLPVARFDLIPELVLTALAAALIAVGLGAFRRRDLASG
jgi:ABC-2 type transport system permease protein